MTKLLLSVCCLLGYSFMIKAQPVTDSILALQHLEAAAEILSEKGDYTDSIALHLNVAKSLFTKGNYWNNYTTEFLKFAQSLYAKGFYKEGINLLQQLQADIQYNSTNSQINETYYQIGRGYYFQQNYDECINVVEANLKRIEQSDAMNKEELKANHYNLIGVSLVGKGLPLEAIDYYQKIFLIRKEIYGIQHNLVASVLNNIGVAYVDLGLYNKALDYYIPALDIREKILGKNHPNLATILNNIGKLYDSKGEYDKSIQYYNRAISIFQENPKGFEAHIADIFSNLAVAYQNKGAYQESTSYHQQAIQQYEQLPEDQSEKIANVYNNWANLLELKKDYKKAIELQQQAITFYANTLEPAHPRMVAAQNNQGINYYKNGEYAKAIAQLQSVVPLIENDAQQREQFANLCNDLADVHFRLNNLPEAKNYNQKALAIQQALFNNKSYKLAYTYNNLAQIAEAEGNRDAALQYLQQALAANHADFEAEYVDAVPSPNGFYQYDYFITSLLHRARLLGAGGTPTAFLQAKLLYEVTDSVLMLVRNELLSSDDKIRLSEKFYDLSQSAIENCIRLAESTGDQRYLEEAFRFSEKSKNNVLAQSLAANHAKQFAGIPDSLIILESQLQSDINFYKQALAEQPDSLERILYQNELFAAQQAYRDLVVNLEKDYALYYELKYDQTVPRVRAIQFSMPDNTTLISYFTGDSTLYIFAIDKNNFTVQRSRIGNFFYSQQVGLRKSITYKLNEEHVELAHDLYRRLFPFTLDNNIQSLIIIPDGTLSKLPFEVLLSKKVNPRTEINFNQLPYLVNNYSIRYALSARLYHQEQSMTTIERQSEGLLAYAPVFDEPQSVDLFSNGARNPVTATETTRMMTLDGKFINPLPATANEIQAIADVFKQKGQKATTYLFNKANKKQLKQSDISRSRYLHIATHGFINEDQPDLSGLLFFPDPLVQDDHVLYSGEVYNLNLNADLVVLSACETGLGKIASGEGLLGLSRAFFYAGANNLIVSLWKVEDQATADLMVSFYQEYLNSKSKNFGTSLRQAKLNLIASEHFSHPYYWSAFVLIGQ